MERQREGQRGQQRGRAVLQIGWQEEEEEDEEEDEEEEVIPMAG